LDGEALATRDLSARVPESPEEIPVLAPVVNHFLIKAVHFEEELSIDRKVRAQEIGDLVVLEDALKKRASDSKRAARVSRRSVLRVGGSQNPGIKLRSEDLLGMVSDPVRDPFTEIHSSPHEELSGARAGQVIFDKTRMYDRVRIDENEPIARAPTDRFV
jgi:hypothetical protein